MAWFDTDWQFRKKITIDPTKVPSDQTDFPVLISITDADIAAGAQADGDDILFTSSDEVTQLSHEIEKYVSGTGELVAWVKIPTVSGSVDTVLFVYYGNPTVGNQEDAVNVWDANFKGVWHLGETSGTTNFDSTSNNNDGTKVAATEPNPAAGKIGGGQDFDGINDFVNVGQIMDYSLDQFTLSAWIKAETIDQGDQNTFISQVGTPSQFRFEIDGENQACGVDALRFLKSPTENDCGATALVAGTFFHVVVTVDFGADELFIYLDGAEDHNDLTYTGIMNSGLDDTHIGRRSSGGQFFDGLMDEVRISDVVRSADWILTEFNNQNSPGTFHTFGAEESITEVDISKDGEYRIVMADQDVTKGAEYRLVQADQDVTKSGKYSVRPTIDITKSAQYAALLKDIDLTKSGLYRLVPTVDVAKSGVYRLLPSIDITKSGQYGLLNVDIDVTKSGEYQILVVTDITKAGEYKVVGTVDVQKTGQYRIIVPPEIALTGQYRILVKDIDKLVSAEYRILFAADQDITKSAEYSVKALIDIIKSGTYRVVAPNDIVVTGAYRVLTETDLGVAGVYSILTVQDISKGAQYLILFAADVDIVLSGKYSLQPSTNVLVNGQYRVQPTFEISKFGKYLMFLSAEQLRSAQYKMLLTDVDTSAKVGRYVLVGQQIAELEIKLPLDEQQREPGDVETLELTLTLVE